MNTDLTDDSPDVTFDASLSIERGWLSQVADEATSSLGTGLTYLNARYYDPLTSRFLSPDPMLDVMDPKTLDPYRYAENNPVFYSDPTGLWSCLSDPTHQGCGGAGAGGAKFGQKDRSGWQAHTDSIVKDQIQHKKRVLRDRMDITTESQWQDIKSTYDSNWEIAKNGLINYGVGFVNGASSMVNGLADMAACGGPINQALGLCFFDVPDIPSIGIVGDYDLYRWSAYSGTMGSFEASMMIGGGGGGAGAAGESEGALVQGANGALRDPLTGRFAANPARVRPPTSSIHGNSLGSGRLTSLYQLFGRDGTYLKTGVTSEANPLSRYTQAFMEDKFMRIINQGPRNEMVGLERLIVEHDPGPLNFEPWAGKALTG